MKKQPLKSLFSKKIFRQKIYTENYIKHKCNVAISSSTKESSSSLFLLNRKEQKEKLL